MFDVISPPDADITVDDNSEEIDEAESDEVDSSDNDDSSDEPEPDPQEGSETERQLTAAQADAESAFGADDAGGVVSACGQQAPAGRQSGSETNTDPDSPNKTWVEFEVVDENGKPVPNIPYRVKLPDGTMTGGTLNRRGRVRIAGIDPGSCKFWLLDMEAKEWKPA